MTDDTLHPHHDPAAELAARLRAAAEAATPGPWEAKTNTHYAQGWLEVIEHWVVDADGLALMDNLIDRGTGYSAAANAAYIATANPRNVLALLDRLAAAEQKSQELATALYRASWNNASLRRQVAAADAETDAARASVAALRGALEYVVSQQVTSMEEADSLLPIAWAARLALCVMRAEQALNGVKG